MSEKSSTDELIKFDEFYKLLEVIVTSNQPSSVSKAFNLIKKGFSDENDIKRVKKSLDLLLNWNSYDILAVKLVLAKYSDKLKPSFAIQICNQLKWHFRKKLNYPTPEKSKSVSINEILNWITKLKKPSNSNYIDDFLPNEHLRMKFVCLFGELNDDELFNSINFLLESHIKTVVSNFQSSKDYYIKSVGKLISKKFSDSTLENLVITSPIFRNEISNLENTENQLRQDLQRSDTLRRNENKEKTALKNHLTEARKDIKTLKAKIEKIEIEKTQLDRQYQDSKSLLQHNNKQNLNSQSSQIRADVNHQLTQLRLCLDDESLGEETYLLFIERIEKIVGKNE